MSCSGATGFGRNVGGGRRVSAAQLGEGLKGGGIPGTSTLGPALRKTEFIPFVRGEERNEFRPTTKPAPSCRSGQTGVASNHRPLRDQRRTMKLGVMSNALAPLGWDRALDTCRQLG